MIIELELPEVQNKIGPSIPYQTEGIFDLGLSVEKLIINANRTTRGLITTSYFGSVTSCIMIAFQLATNCGEKDWQENIHRIVIITAYICATLMYLTRIRFMMVSGEKLGNAIIQSKRDLEDYCITHEETFKLTKPVSNKLLVLQKRLNFYQFVSPITPYGVLNLSRKTFYSTLAVIITYIVVLIKLRGGTIITSEKDHEH